MCEPSAIRYRETLPLYYCSVTFCLDHKGHRDYSATDGTFYRWLQRNSTEDLQRIRYLELSIRVPFIPPAKTGATKDPSVATINIDLSVTNPDRAVEYLDYYSDCPLMTKPLVRKAIAKIPRVEKKPLVTREVLWDIWEACYFLSRSDPRERRTWPTSAGHMSSTRAKTTLSDGPRMSTTR
ncbi:hypothetical protein CLAFUW4_10988 [Fulvia fulva]|uniref:Uncharacterized protein n=1 Tax=Passalora fulva TaxID=5499 RepID=A0A9Q8PD64_PASFU|nr:uncharacterized protein CLAFUR5_10031 [Fulvia fulva]KAK4619966.1 hypothetical protein CLAFUR4_10993 [Fulvia fulva]KAK4621146.1 hypothetical protein CLAFUR0_11000 [Fulvia fulva]UJO20299.1 hypothetical protein CLAFUR5_10031 [Fulvia fulva]WPV17438.1 hypothetical protein CLAFUW4_10988 [Fulvia fulva]WPV31825.1 hypothetical protein CLAFUW7_10986 [Fulvia fulva]